MFLAVFLNLAFSYILSKGILKDDYESKIAATTKTQFCGLSLKLNGSMDFWRLDHFSSTRQLGEKRRKKQTTAKRLHVPNGRWWEVWWRRKERRLAHSSILLLGEFLRKTCLMMSLTERSRCKMTFWSPLF